MAEPAAVYQGDDESAILAAAEMLMKSSLSSLTQGYGSILLSRLFLFHILSLSLSSTSAFSSFVAVIHLSLLESTFLIYMFFKLLWPNSYVLSTVCGLFCLMLSPSFLRVFTLKKLLLYCSFPSITLRKGESKKMQALMCFVHLEAAQKAANTCSSLELLY